MANNMIACRKSFTDTLLELARQDKDIVAGSKKPTGAGTFWGFFKKIKSPLCESGGGSFLHTPAHQNEIKNL